MKQRLAAAFSILIVATALFLLTKPFFHDGFFPTMDDVQVIRIDEMSREIESGQFPVRYVDNLGNSGGYMLFNFYTPFVYYIGTFYYLVLGLPLVASTKLVFLTAYGIGTIGMMVLLKRYADWLLVAAGTVLFLTATYVAYDVYTRGALAEFFALMLLPWLFWAFLRLKEKPLLSNILIAGSAYGLVIISHNITSFTASVFLVLLVLLPPLTKKNFLYAIYAALVGLGLSAFVWLPVVFEQQYTALHSTDFVTKTYTSHFLNPLQVAGIQNIPWGFRQPLLGLGLFIGALASIVWFSIRHKMHQKVNPIVLFAGLTFCLSLMLVWSISKPIWDVVPLMKDMQFPWRYLGVTTIAAIFLIILALSTLKRRWLGLLIAGVVLIPAVTLQNDYLYPKTYTYIGKYIAEDTCRTTTWAQEQLPIWVDICLPKNNAFPPARPIAEGVIIERMLTANNGRVVKFDTASVNGGEVEITKYYFPGWTATLDGGTALEITPTKPYGTMAVTVPPGNHSVSVKFLNTPMRTIANLISFLSIAWLVLYLLIFQLPKHSTHLVSVVIMGKTHRKSAHDKIRKRI